MMWNTMWMCATEIATQATAVQNSSTTVHASTASYGLIWHISVSCGHQPATLSVCISPRDHVQHIYEQWAHTFHKRLFHKYSKTIVRWCRLGSCRTKIAWTVYFLPNPMRWKRQFGTRATVCPRHSWYHATDSNCETVEPSEAGFFSDETQSG